jgi:Tfp pilus assembly protein PilN
MTAPNELSFLPEDYLEQKYKMRANVICVILIVLTGVAIAAIWWQRSTKHARVVAEFTDVNNNYIDAARKIEQVKKMHEQQREVVHHAELAASLVEKVPRSNMLAEITNALPIGVSLIDLAMTSKPHTEAAGSQSAFEHRVAEGPQNDAMGLGTKPPQFDVALKLTGIARDDIQVAQLISRLSHSSMFQDVNLVVSDTYSDGQPGATGKAVQLRKWQLEMMLNPQAEVHEETKTAAVELGK